MEHAHTLVMRTPSSWKSPLWREALPLGNGEIGTLVYGSVAQETLLITHSRLWFGRKRTDLPDISHALAETRRLFHDGRFAEANTHMYEVLGETGYDSRIPEPFPLADLTIRMPANFGFSRYRRELHMDTGEAITSWQDGGTHYRRSTFVHRTHDIIVCLIESDGPPLDITVSLALHDETDSQFPLADQRIQTSARTRTTPETGTCCFMANLPSGDDSPSPIQHFGAVLQVHGQGASYTEDSGALHATGTHRLCIVIHPFVEAPSVPGITNDSLIHALWDEKLSYIAVLGHDYAQLLRTHVALHAPLFHSAKLTLGSDRRDLCTEQLLLEAYDGQAPAELLQTLWEFGRYLAISSLREGGLPCPLYGLWCGDYHPIWSQHVINENLQIIHWHLMTGNLLPLMVPVFDYFDQLLEDFRQNARNLFGCRGIVIPAYTAPGIGLPTVTVPVILNWTGGAAWVGALYHRYAVLSGDREFLIKRALPFLREVAAFYEDFLVEDEAGVLHIVPSVSPENSPGNHVPASYDGLSHPMPTTRDAASDIALIKEALTNLVDLCRRGGIDDPNILRWQRMVVQLPAYRINDEGALAEWIDPQFDDNYQHRHMMHIYPLFPGSEIGRHGDQRMVDACRIAIDKRLDIGLADQCNWSYVHMAHVHARMGSGDQALSCIDLFTRSCLMGNLLSASNDWRRMGITLDFSPMPFQIDGNMGIVSALQEMLVQTSVDTLYILPALPARLTCGSFACFTTVFGSVSCSWDREAGEIHGILAADAGLPFNICFPPGFVPSAQMANGHPLQAATRDTTLIITSDSVTMPTDIEFTARLRT